MTRLRDGPIRDGPEGIEVDVWVCPRSSKNAIAGIHRGRIKVHIQAPPVDGAANREVVRLLAKTLDVAPSTIRCLRGASARTKTFAIDGVERATAMEKLGVDARG